MRFGFVSQFTSKGLPPSSANDCLKSRNCPNSNPDGNPWRQFACWGCHLNTGFARAFEEPRIISAGETGQCTSVTLCQAPCRNAVIAKFAAVISRGRYPHGLWLVRF
jgi:hypothetical protein